MLLYHLRVEHKTVFTDYIFKQKSVRFSHKKMDLRFNAVPQIPFLFFEGGSREDRQVG